MIFMGKNDDFQSLIESLAYYRGDSARSEGLMKKFIGLWSSYGDKKFLGKKGKKVVGKSLQELYVMIDVSREHIAELQNLIDHMEDENEEMNRIKKIRAKDSLNAELVKFNHMEEKYKFMSMLQAVNELMSAKDSKFMKKLDKTLKNRQMIREFQNSIKEEINDHGRIMEDMDNIELYFETLTGKTVKPEPESKLNKPDEVRDDSENEKDDSDNEDENPQVI